MARKNKYPGIYARWNTLWMMYRDVDGTLIRELTELPVGKERQAYAMPKELKARVAAAKRVAEETGVDGPVTLEGYAVRWAARRKERGISSARDDETRLKLHVLPYTADRRINEAAEPIFYRLLKCREIGYRINIIDCVWLSIATNGFDSEYQNTAFSIRECR